MYSTLKAELLWHWSLCLWVACKAYINGQDFEKKNVLWLELMKKTFSKQEWKGGHDLDLDDGYIFM